MRIVIVEKRAYEDETKYPGLYLQPDQDEGGGDLEDRGGNNGSAHVHQGMEEVAEFRRRPFKRNHKRVALEAFVGKIQQGHDAFTQIDGGSTLAIHVQSLGLARKFQNNPIEVSAKVWSGNGDTFGIGESLKTVIWEDRHEKVESVLSIDRSNGIGAAAATLAA